jgi:beta-carotene/zeaxanthin 4-ketolase
VTLTNRAEIAPSSRRPAAAARQTAIGLALATAVLGGWLGLHLYGVFFYTPGRDGWAVAPVLVVVQAWLGVGLFIVAHDAMHGSLAPGRPGWNEAVGRLATTLYNPGFVYPKLHANHHAHHRAPGTADDPDFHPDRPRAFAAWFLRFFRTYFGWWEFARLTVVLLIYLFVFRAKPLNFFVFWAAPALLSALQLFTFGTWLPHRHEALGFADRHHARTLEFGWITSLLTCFHFGYHLEHHHSPGTPWWALPRYRAERRALARAHGEAR